MRIDLNADIGESFGVYRTGSDNRLFRTITSGNVACGFHAGDPGVMRGTVRAASSAGVVLGAHPGFPDLQGFGRRDMEIEPAAIQDLVLYQIGALVAIARAEGVALRHVKPHGALYNMSARRAEIADAIARAVDSYDKTLVLVGLPGSELLAAGSRLGLRVVAEGFADRSYEADGSLTPRRLPGAVLTDASRVAERAIRMVTERQVIARDGSVVPLQIDTICVHGDTPHAADLAAAIRSGLEEHGVTIAPLA